MTVPCLAEKLCQPAARGGVGGRGVDNNDPAVAAIQQGIGRGQDGFDITAVGQRRYNGVDLTQQGG